MINGFLITPDFVTTIGNPSPIAMLRALSSLIPQLTEDARKEIANLNSQLNPEIPTDTKSEAEVVE